MEQEILPNEETQALVKVEKLDERWAERMAAASDFDLIELVRVGKESEAAQKEKFLAGEIENPSFEFPNADEFDPEPFEKKLLALKEEIKLAEENRVVRTLYLWKINEQLAKLRLVQAIKESKGRSPKEQRQYDRKVYWYSRFIWGEPPIEVRELALQEAEERITPQKPKGPKGEKLTGEEMTAIFNELIEEYKAKAEAEVSPDVFVMTVVAPGLKDPEVLIPGDKPKAIQRVKELASHEIEAHVLQREGGRRLGHRLSLLQLGLDRYSITGEGLGIFAERRMGKETAGHPWLLAAMALAKTKNFRETFEALKEDYINFRMRKGLSREEAAEKANDKCWAFCRRIFRGIRDTSSPGHFLTRDWAYRKGRLGVMAFVDNYGEENLRFLYLGRVGLKHLGLLFELGITEPAIEPRFIAGEVVDRFVAGRMVDPETGEVKELTKEK